MQTTRQASTGPSDDVLPVTMGFVDDIQQQAAALVQFHYIGNCRSVLAVFPQASMEQV